MEYRAFITLTKIRLVFLFVITAATVTGCTGMQIKEDRRVALIAGSEQRGTDQTSVYIMKYLYRYDRTNPDGSGSVYLKANIGVRARLKSLTISVNWLDDDGRLLESKAFWYSGVNKKYNGWNIEETYQIPPGTRALAFTSTSQSREGR